MSTPFIGEIKVISFNFAPRGWALCSGQLLPINQNQALFSLLGTYYGGNGTTTFGLPDLRGRTCMHTGNGFVLGQRAGEEFHTLTGSEIPAHTHVVSATKSNAITSGTGGTVPAGGTKIMAQAAASVGKALVPVEMYGQGAVSGAMAPDTIASVGGSQGHENRQPFLVLNFIVALQGIFPSQN